MGYITEDMILEAVIMDGFPSKNTIYNYVQGLTTLKDRAGIVSKTGTRLKSLVTYGILREVKVNGQSYYCFPDCRDDKPIVAPPGTKVKQALDYIERLPDGAQFTVVNVQHAVACDHCTAYNVIKSLNLAFYKKIGQAHVYIKGASI